MEKGGKLKKLGGSLVSYQRFPDRYDKKNEPAYSNPVDLNQYDAIVFVGQWIRPLHFFANTRFPFDYFMTSAVVKEISKQLILNPFPYAKSENQINNEPLSVFPQLIDSKKIILFPDPFPRQYSANLKSLEHPHSSLYHNYRRRLRHIKLFYNALDELVDAIGINICHQIELTFDAELLVTFDQYRVSDDEYIHMNEKFWLLNLNKSIIPAIKSVLRY